MNKTTFSEWNKALKQTNANFWFDLNNGNRHELKKEGFPTFDYWSFDADKINFKKIKSFFNKYKFIVVILYPKNLREKQPYRQCKSLDSLFGFLERHKPLNRYKITIGEQKKAEYGGTIISSNNFVLCEIAKGRQDILAHGSAKKIWSAVSKFGLSLIYSENCKNKEKEIISKSLSYLRYDREYMEGYWEFFYCNKNIYFTDYKKSKNFRKEISRLIPEQV